MPKNQLIKTEKLNLRSEEVQEILTNPPSWIVRWGISIIFVFTIIVVTLSFIIEYPDFVKAKVLVTTKKTTERIVARYSGAIQEIFVKNGDTVVMDTQLAVLKNTANLKDITKLKDILDTIKLGEDTFTFPMDSLSGLVLGDVEPAYVNFEKSYMDYLMLQQLDPYRGQISSNHQSLTEIKNRLNNQLKQKLILEQEYQLVKGDFNRHKQLFEKGVISQQEYEAKRVEFLQMQKSLNNMEISISQLREAITSAGQTLNATKISKIEDESRFRVNLSQSLNTLRKAIIEWDYNYALKSSIDGVVSFQEFWGANQFINSGEEVFTILPIDTDNLIGKLVLSSQNAGKVTIGQKVLMKIDNFPYQQYGMLVGKVENISVSPNSEGNYIVYVSLPNGTLTSYKKKLPFEQELLGNAEIITNNLSVAERIFFKFKNVLLYN